jgi:hypothetical protein
MFKIVIVESSGELNDEDQPLTFLKDICHSLVRSSILTKNEALLPSQMMIRSWGTLSLTKETKKLVINSKKGSIPDWLTVSCNMTQTKTQILKIATTVFAEIL